ncbi:pimeloyl-ACP methyl ester carboxylesterase [Streptomyces collinus]
MTDSRTVADAARTEWPLHGIAQDVTEHARMIDVPALVVAGEHDQVEPVGVLRDNLVPYLSHPDFVVVPRTGHLIPLEAPADLIDAITAFASTA